MPPELWGRSRPGRQGSEPVRVLFVYDHLGYPRGATHGLTRYSVDVLTRLNSGPVELTACYLREDHRAADEMARRGLPPIFLRRSRWDPGALLDVRRLILERDIDIVHAAGQKGILVGRTAALMTGRRTIIHLRDVFPLGPVIGRMIRGGARWTDLALGVSKAVCLHAESTYGIPPQRVRLLYNGADFSRFQPISAETRARWRATLGIGPGTRLIGAVGRLAPEKGHMRLLRQMQRVRSRLPGAVLAVAGDGPLRSDLEDLARRLGVAEAVRFLGQRDDVRDLLGALDVLAVPSDHEGLSMVALESLSVGTPVVATDVGGCPEVLDNGAHGYLFSPDREDTLGDQLLEALLSPDEARTRTLSATDHLERFALRTHVQMQQQIYLDLVRGRGPGTDGPPG
ncbi:MAG: glycosyltransferase [Gemmatimonadales bacterium]|nr:MAG: glycosyltransferase [Gemmatimonadales bacterium]